MPHHTYLIVGSGMTADAAARGIREVDPEGSIGIIGEDPHPPYDRPPLSKGLWLGTDEERIWRSTADLGAEIHLSRRVLRIDPPDRTVTDDRGSVYTWDKLLLATGARPRELDDAVPQVVYFRTLEDYHLLRRLSDGGHTFAVVGGGFIGSEIASALAGAGKEVALMFPEEGLLGRLLPTEMGRRLNDYYRDHGVDVRSGVGVASVRRSGDRLLVATEEADPTRTLRVDGVVAGLGVVPNQELAETAGLTVRSPEEGGGIVVDHTFQTSVLGIWAAGDVAAFHSPHLGQRIRVEHEDQANSSGRHAGRAMAGEEAPYDHLPLFYSDLFEVGYEAVGLVDSALDVVEVRADGADGAGGLDDPAALYYRDEGGRVRGALFWNSFGNLDTARQLIRSAEPYAEEALKKAADLG